MATVDLGLEYGFNNFYERGEGLRPRTPAVLSRGVLEFKGAWDKAARTPKPAFDALCDGLVAAALARMDQYHKHAADTLAHAAVGVEADKQPHETATEAPTMTLPMARDMGAPAYWDMVAASQESSKLAVRTAV